jgi:hypothetical protein
MSKNITANVVGMIMRRQRPGYSHVVIFGLLDDARYIPGRIHNHAFPFRVVSNQIYEVGHLDSEVVGMGKFTARE